MSQDFKYFWINWEIWLKCMHFAPTVGHLSDLKDPDIYGKFLLAVQIQLAAEHPQEIYGLRLWSACWNV